MVISLLRKIKTTKARSRGKAVEKFSMIDVLNNKMRGEDDRASRIYDVTKTRGEFTMGMQMWMGWTVKRNE